jgi:hypothetical protein
MRSCSGPQHSLAVLCEAVQIACVAGTNSRPARCGNHKRVAGAAAAWRHFQPSSRDPACDPAFLVPPLHVARDIPHPGALPRPARS